MSRWWEDGELVARFDAKWEKGDGCWLWTAGKYAQGYGSFRIGEKMYKAHRLSFSRSIGRPLLEGESVLHSCDVRNCVNPSHLRIGTYADNAHDRDIRLRAGTSTITPDIVRQIRELAKAGIYQKEIAAKFGVRQGTISRIVSGKRWGWIK